MVPQSAVALYIYREGWSYRFYKLGSIQIAYESQTLPGLASTGLSGRGHRIVWCYRASDRCMAARLALPLLVLNRMVFEFQAKQAVCVKSELNVNMASN